MELLERASQLKALNSALSQVKARDGQGCVALVYGEAGIGKISLLEHFIDENKKAWRVLQGVCDSLFKTYVTRILSRFDFELRVQIATWAKNKGLV